MGGDRGSVHREWPSARGDGLSLVENDAGNREYVAVPGMPPVNSAQDPVRAAIAAEAQGRHTGLVGEPEPPEARGALARNSGIQSGWIGFPRTVDAGCSSGRGVDL